VQDLTAGRAAVVTGGARGIGLAVVEAIAARGVGVLCLDHPDADYGAFHEACRRAGVPADHVGVDVRDQGGVRDAVARASELGPVSYAVNCAGVDGLMESAAMSAGEWSRVVAVDLDGVMFACQAEYELMSAQGGSIVNIASMSGHIVPFPREPGRGSPHEASGPPNTTPSRAESGELRQLRRILPSHGRVRP
jgi:NAD(P)-dependent dehydrogenase (short-subunit alcohol dehydrogenase family)